MSSEWGELSSEYGASCLLNVGRVVLGEFSLGRVVLGRVVFGASCPDPLIVYPCSGIRRRCRRCRGRPPFLNVFSSETAWPIKVKFYVEPPWEGGTKVCINGRGHMTKMAAMPIYGKNLKNSSSQEPAGRFPPNLVCITGDSCPS